MAWKEQLHTALAPLQQRATTYYRGLSGREQQILVACGAIIVVALVSWGWGAATEAFDDQYRRIAQVEQQLSKLASEVDQYSKWKGRKDAIEKRFRQVEIKEGVASYLETLLRTKAEVSKGFSIKDLGASEFGKDFQQESYSVTFSTSNLAALVAFLKELTFGERPVVLSRLDLEMPSHRTALDVRLEVAAIRNAGDAS